MAATRAEEQIFPEVTRVHYAKAALDEVVCQVRFPADLRLEKDPPAEFQQRIRAMFPLLNHKIQSVTGALPPEIAKALQAVVPPSGTNTIWQFATEDGNTRLELTKENLTLITENYERWNQFWESFNKSLEAFVEIYKPPFIVRIGLRYKNLIRRSALGLDDVSWHELLNPHVLGELAIPEVGQRAVEAARNLLLTLPEREAKVRVQHGFATKGTDEQCYLIDCDFFVERSDVNDASDTIVYLHKHAARHFRWCIAPRLHDAMAPDPVSG